MGDERRVYDRQLINRQLILGAFVLAHAGRQIKFEALEDVSISGVGIIISERLNNGDGVELGYQHEEKTITVRGKVVWVVDDSLGFRTGIYFDPINVQDNVTFFMNMREYVEDFAR
ncbi:MAG: PilZ domain-containing protein [Gammaproteobacteria bacterium]|nr:PilZ domain-containing protein [Gammaproteobacteria bacterium]